MKTIKRHAYGNVEFHKDEKGNNL